MFTIIASIGKNRELGLNGKLVFHIPQDMDFFKKKTANHKVVMGRKTWDSLPHKLKNRTNMVVSRTLIDSADQTISDLDTFIKENENTAEEIFVIGGGQIYAKFLPYVKKMYLTEVNKETEADTFFPEFNICSFIQKTLERGYTEDMYFEIKEYLRFE